MAIMIVNRNPPQPRIPDETEQDLQKEVDIANVWFFLALFVFASTRFTYQIFIVYIAEWLNIQDQYIDHYYKLIGYYCLFFISLPVIAVTCLQDRWLCMKNDLVLFYFVAVEYVYICMTLAHLHYHGSLFSLEFFTSIIFGGSFISCLAYEWYLASKNLKLYQHGNRH